MSAEACRERRDVVQRGERWRVSSRHITGPRRRERGESKEGSHTGLASIKRVKGIRCRKEMHKRKVEEKEEKQRKVQKKRMRVKEKKSEVQKDKKKKRRKRKKKEKEAARE